jgi:hypothetical protein
MPITLSAVIPGRRASVEPGIHIHRLWLMVWTAPYGISCARMRLS